jgi:hypothetical protein
VLADALLCARHQARERLMKTEDGKFSLNAPSESDAIEEIQLVLLEELC